METVDVAAKVYKVIKYGIIFGLSLSMIVLVGGSLLVRDTYYITKNPKFFLSETMVMGFLSALPIVYISWLRKIPIASTSEEFVAVFIKVALLHVGLQLSGVYSVFFPTSSKMDKDA